MSLELGTEIFSVPRGKKGKRDEQLLNESIYTVHLGKDT